MTTGLKAAQTAKSTVKRTLEAGAEDEGSEDDKDAPPKKEKKKSTGSSPNQADLNVNGIPKGFERWSHATKLAWLKPDGLCRLCADKGQKVKGLSEHHEKDKHKETHCQFLSFCSSL